MDIYQYFTHDIIPIKQIRSVLEWGKQISGLFERIPVTGCGYPAQSSYYSIGDAFFNLGLCGGFYFRVVYMLIQQDFQPPPAPTAK